MNESKCDKPERVNVPLSIQETLELDHYAAAARTSRSEAARRLIKVGLGHDIGPDHAIALQRFERIKAMEAELPLPSRAVLKRSRQEGTHAERVGARRDKSVQSGQTPD